jgi:peptidoglycan DL-endopeptidase CwlO
VATRPARPRLPVRLLAVASMSVALVFAVVPASSAHPATAPQASVPTRLTIPQVEARVSALQAEAEVAAEQADGARSEYTSGLTTLASLHARVVAQQASAARVQSQLGAMAADAYQTGGLGKGMQLLTTSDPSQFLDQSTSLSTLASEQNNMLAQVQAANLTLAADEQAESQQVSQLHAISNQVNAAQSQVNANLRAAQDVLSGLQAGQRRAYEQAVAAKRAAALAASRIAIKHATGSTSHSSSHFHFNPTGSGGAGAAVAFAEAQVGKSYVFGASGPGAYDCSGLTMRAWQAGGVSLPHQSAEQYSDTQHVSRGDLQPGDLLFFYSPIHHVGIYIGGGEFVHAANPGQGVIVSSLSGYWSSVLSGASRP